MQSNKTNKMQEKKTTSINCYTYTTHSSLFLSVAKKSDIFAKYFVIMMIEVRLWENLEIIWKMKLFVDVFLFIIIIYLPLDRPIVEVIFFRCWK